MQLAAPSPAVTKPFNMTVTQKVDGADVAAQTTVEDVVTSFGAKLDSFEWNGMSLESNPPQHPINGTVTGPSAAVDAAIAAIDVLDYAL